MEKEFDSNAWLLTIMIFFFLPEIQKLRMKSNLDMKILGAH